MRDLIKALIIAGVLTAFIIWILRLGMEEAHVAPPEPGWKYMEPEPEL